MDEKGFENCDASFTSILALPSSKYRPTKKMQIFLQSSVGLIRHEPAWFGGLQHGRKLLGTASFVCVACYVPILRRGWAVNESAIKRSPPHRLALNFKLEGLGKDDSYMQEAHDGQKSRHERVSTSRPEWSQDS
jgi:hypothetical protein